MNYINVQSIMVLSLGLPYFWGKLMFFVSIILLITNFGK